MPEGDTIHRTAHNLRLALEGQPVQAFEARDLKVEPERVVGKRVDGIEARGKHLLVRFEGGDVLHTHMRMSGSWHLYSPASRWRKPRRYARVVLTVPERVAVCFSAPVVAWLTPSALRHHPQLSRLGPDLLDGAAAVPAAAKRLQRLGAMPVGEALLRQDCVSGIGNVYKSEALFAAGLAPTTPMENVDGETLLGLLASTRRSMLANLGGLPRNTRRALTGPRYAVYGRAGEPCLTCGTRIERTYQGETRRSTYACPACQPSR